jgi:hypothetical protein
MMQKLVSYFAGKGVACPVDGLRTEEEWTILILNQDLLQQPSLEARRTVAKGFLEVGSECLWSVCDHPADGHFHGTDVQTALQILCEGRMKTATDLGNEGHNPDGIYSFPHVARSNVSSYVHQGAQLRLTVCSLPISYNKSLWVDNNLKRVPTGVSCRRQRSGIKAWGATMGTEWCHNPDSIRIEAMRIKTHKLQEWLMSSGAFDLQVLCVPIFFMCCLLLCDY